MSTTNATAAVRYIPGSRPRLFAPVPPPPIARDVAGFDDLLRDDDATTAIAGREGREKKPKFRGVHVVVV